MKKTTYETPSVQLVIFQSQDIITTSSLTSSFFGEEDMLGNEET